jgi:hypothetical protein
LDRLHDIIQIVMDWKDYHLHQFDFGDSWTHSSLVEKIETIPSGYELHISCTGGKNATPPEDVGGEPGYENSLKFISDPKHAEHYEMLEWAKRNTELHP